MEVGLKSTIFNLSGSLQLDVTHFFHTAAQDLPIRFIKEVVKHTKKY